jgi:plastocyanin
MRRVFLAFVLAAASLGLLALTSPRGQADERHGAGHQSARISSSPTVMVPSPYGLSGRMTQRQAPERPRYTRDVRLYDNYFSPSLLYVPSGTTVRWTNHGKHHHTVTAFGLLDSGEVEPGGSFSAHFVYPGTYDYLCEFHPARMYGQVVVY